MQNSHDFSAFWCRIVNLKESQLHLYDLVGPKIFPLEEILQYMPVLIKESYIYFSPDKLGEHAQAEPYILDGDSILMVKGPFYAEKSAFMIPRTSRF